ncbi:alpha-tocopherol transfer protein-like [Lycorma delicatula]|uniref:alpha-tocopherol transfer protein-like n=1 Tax=Lycorma delicatula TaxID=130591 RepID=UPI003F51109B
MYLKTMTEEQIQNTLKEYGMSAAELKSMVLILKEWLKQQHHLPQYMSEQALQFYLWSSKRSLERVKQKLDAYFTMRSLLPHVFSNRDPCTEEMVLYRKTSYLFPFPRLTKDGFRVIYFKFNSSDKDFCFLTHCISAINMTDYCITNDYLTNGTYLLIDGKNFTLNFMQKFNITELQKLISCVTEILPSRLKGIFYFNNSSTFKYVTAIFFPFISKKIRERVHLLNDYEELYKLIGKEVLPKEYGGEEASIDELNDAWQKTMESFKEWIMTEGSLLTDESKRPEKCKYKYSDFFGAEGSFRQLQID